MLSTIISLAAGALFLVLFISNELGRRRRIRELQVQVHDARREIDKLKSTIFKLELPTDATVFPTKCRCLQCNDLVPLTSDDQNFCSTQYEKRWKELR